MRTFSSAWDHSSGKPISFPFAAFVNVCTRATFVPVYAAAFLSQPSSHLSSPLINLHSAALRIPSCFSPLLLQLLLTATSACHWSHEEAISGEFSVECETLSRFNSLSASANRDLDFSKVWKITLQHPIVGINQMAQLFYTSVESGR